MNGKSDRLIPTVPILFVLLSIIVILSSLQKLGIVKKVVTHITTGYISFPVCEIDEEILNKYVA